MSHSMSTTMPGCATPVMVTSTDTLYDAWAAPGGPLVLAAPFRAHVTHLISTAQVPWPLVAYQAGVPLATLRTLLFGRSGRIRPKIDYETATRLITVQPQDLAWMRHAQISTERTSSRIRLLRGRHAAWEEISRFLCLDVPTCQAIARGERTSCSIMTDILAQMACDVMGFQWDEVETAV